MKRNGATVLVGMPPSGVMATIDPGYLAADGQKILGSKMGSARPLIDVPMIVALYREGRLKLDELISGRYRLEADQRGGRLVALRRGAEQRDRVLTPSPASCGRGRGEGKGAPMKIAELKTFVVGNPPPAFGGRYFLFLKLKTACGDRGRRRGLCGELRARRRSWR